MASTDSGNDIPNAAVDRSYLDHDCTDGGGGWMNPGSEGGDTGGDKGNGLEILDFNADVFDLVEIGEVLLIFLDEDKRGERTDGRDMLDRLEKSVEKGILGIDERDSVLRHLRGGESASIAGEVESDSEIADRCEVLSVIGLNAWKSCESTVLDLVPFNETGERLDDSCPYSGN